MKPSDQAPRGRPRLRQDDQRWIFDYIVKEAGDVYHWWGDGGRELPKGVRSHAMIPKQLGKQGQQVEALARVETAAGHPHVALALWLAATRLYLKAQHPIFELGDEKRFLYDAMRRCYDEARALAPYPIERVEVPWNGTTVSGWLHVLPGRPRAPLLFHVPGSDTTAEGAPDPTENLPHQRGMHVFAFDGPGQGQSNMRGIRLTADNYEDAAGAMLDKLVTLPEVDPERVVVYGTGQGGFWAMRVAAHDRRVKAAATKSSYADKYFVLTEDSPRYRRLFAFLTQAATEEELEATMAAMTLEGHVEKVTCPTLLVVGEYDHRDPLDEVYRVFDRLGTPGELWVFADQFHKVKLPGGGEIVSHLMFDWLADRLAGRPQAQRGQVLWLDPGGEGPNASRVTRKRRWFDPSR